MFLLLTLNIFHFFFFFGVSSAVSEQVIVCWGIRAGITIVGEQGFSSQVKQNDTE